jgi:hypothetical protein
VTANRAAAASPAILARHGIWVVALALIALITLGTGSADAQRGVPVAMFNVNNQVMNSPNYVYAVRFVIDQDTSLYRFISGFNLEGAKQLGGRQGYSGGSGGKILARLVAVKPNGEPDMSQVLASETVDAWQRYQESKAAYGAPGLTQLLYFNTGGVQLVGGQMYAMTYQNADSSPAMNFFSENSPTVKQSVAGPNGVNNLDPNAPGAIDNLDPREAVAWSKDSGQSWVWGRFVGEGDTPGAYGGSATSDDGTRLPWYGWQTSPSSAPQSNQPYYAYQESGSYTLRVPPLATDTTLSEAGGYAPEGASAGILTVRNLSSGEVGQTASLGTGLVKGTLDNPVKVEAGQSYEISNSGTVLKAEADSFIQSTFGVGGGAWAYETVGQGYDRAELYANAPSGVSSPTRVIVKRATIADPGPASTARASASTARSATPKRAARLNFIGRVSGALPPRGLRVVIKVGRRDHWRKIGRTRLYGNGRFRLHRRTRALDAAHLHLRARAIVWGVGRSPTVHVSVLH